MVDNITLRLSIILLSNRTVCVIVKKKKRVWSTHRRTLFAGRVLSLLSLQAINLNYAITSCSRNHSTLFVILDIIILKLPRCESLDDRWRCFAISSYYNQGCILCKARYYTTQKFSWYFINHGHKRIFWLLNSSSLNLKRVDIPRR